MLIRGQSLQILRNLPFALSESLKQFHNNDAVTLNVSGAVGDINHIDVHWGHRQKGHENAARMGMILAGEVLSQWSELISVAGPLIARSEMVNLALPSVNAEEVETSKNIIQTTRNNTRAKFMKLVQAHKVLDVAARNGKPLEVEVQVITLEPV